MISWGWLILIVPLSAGFGWFCAAICVDSARRREAQEYNLVLRRIAKARRADPQSGYCQTREHADRLANQMLARTRRRGSE